MNQSQFLAISCNSLEAREKSRVRDAIGFGFDSHWLKNGREYFKPITKRSNRNHVITFDSHLKTALVINLCLFLLGTFGEVELASFGILFQWASFVFMVRSFPLFFFSFKYMNIPSSPSIWKSFAWFMRDLKICGGDVKENVTSKYNFALSQVFRDYSILFTSYIVGEVS